MSRQFKPAFIAIDPGVNTGWAKFYDGVPVKWGRIRSSPSETFEGTVAGLCIGLRTLLDQEPVDHLVLETPELHQSAGGMVTARSGALIKLTLITGAYMGVAFSRGGVYIYNVRPSMWKGQLPKTIVAARVQARMSKKTNFTDMDSHMIDAVGLGFFWNDNYSIQDPTTSEYLH